MGFLDEFKRLAHPYEDEEEDNFEDDFDASPRPIERRERERAPRSEPAYSSPVMDELEARRSNKVVNIRAATQLQVVLERDWGASYSLSGGQVFQEELTGVVYELVRPKAETVGTVYADLDGDGSDETVRLCAEETVEPDESGVPLVTDEAALRPYRLETEVDGRAAACALGDAGERYEGVARLFVTADRAGAPVIVAGLSEEGESGELAVYALSWDSGTGSFVRLEAPRYSIQGLLEGTTAHVVVPETGNAEDLDLNWWLSRQNAQTAPEAGQPGAPEQAGGICGVGPAEQGIQVIQPLWNRDQAEKMGWLVTQVTWKDREPAVVSQYFDWQAEAAEDVLR